MINGDVNFKADRFVITNIHDKLKHCCKFTSNLNRLIIYTIYIYFKTNYCNIGVREIYIFYGKRFLYTFMLTKAYKRQKE